MKKIMKALLALMLLCGCSGVSVKAEEAGETAEELNGFYPGMQFETLIKYMDKYGSYQNGNSFIYKKYDSGYELYIMYQKAENNMLMVVREWGTDSPGKPDVLELQYNAQTLKLLRCNVTLERGRSEKVWLVDENFKVLTFTQNTFDETFVYGGTTTKASYDDGIKANNFLRRGLALLDNHMVATALDTKVMSLDELGFVGLGYLKNIRAFVERLYVMCLRRQPDRSGLVNWVIKLYKKQISAAECARGFFLSKEMTNQNLSDSDYVDRCYQVIINRPADTGGRNYWVERLENGMSRTWVLKGFVDSSEFAGICEVYKVDTGTIMTSEARDINYGITSFVARCYKQVLGRKYDVPGLNSWCAKIHAASNKKKAAIDMASTGFFHSPEFLKKNTTNEQYVTILYQTFLNRKPDNGGFVNWIKKLESGMSRDAVLNGFAYSPEFAKLMAQYGIS